MLAPKPCHARRAQPRRDKQTPTICVVDARGEDYKDWAHVRRANVVMLRSAEDALRLSRTRTIDLWVVNMELPGLSGCELCSMLKSHTPRVPVYLVTDSYTPAAERSAWRSRATLFLCKESHREWLTDWLPCDSPAATRALPIEN